MSNAATPSPSRLRMMFARWQGDAILFPIQSVPGDDSGQWLPVYLLDREVYDPSAFLFRYVLRHHGGTFAIYEEVAGTVARDYRMLRREAYPDIADQLDALWKGGEALDAMRAAVMAVKQQYPKPPSEE